MKTIILYVESKNGFTHPVKINSENGKITIIIDNEKRVYNVIDIDNIMISELK